jgi:hypothetical protein
VKTRKARKCGKCGELGHDIRSCPQVAEIAASMQERGVGEIRESFLPERWDFVPTSSAELLEFDSVEVAMRTDVAGAYVKLAPALRPSERAAFDGARIREELLGRGALAVRIAPRPLPESSTTATTETPVVVDTREMMRTWIDRQVGVSEHVRTRALEMVLELAEAEGL